MAERQWRQSRVRAMRSLFSKTLEATGNGSLHFSCQTLASLMAFSQRVVKQKAQCGQAETKKCVWGGRP